MPTIYTEDKVGKAIEDHYYGTQGVYTGSVANSIGYNEYQNRQRSSTVSAPPVSGSGSGSPAGGVALLLVGGAVAAGLYWDSWVAGVAAFAGLFAIGFVLWMFFTSAIGQMVLYALAVLFWAAAACFGLYIVHAQWGMVGVAWVVGAILAVAAVVLAFMGLSMLASWFFSTAAGRAVVRAVQIAFFSALGIGALALAVYVFS